MGDVFALPLTPEGEDAGSAAPGSQVGQVVATRPSGLLHVAFYGDPHRDPPEAPCPGLTQATPALLLLTLPLFLKNRRWPVIGHQPVPGSVELPAYKVSLGVPQVTWVADHAGDPIRPASPQEADLLAPPSTVSMAMVEMYVKAWHGLLPQPRSYEAARYRPERSEHRLGIAP